MNNEIKEKNKTTLKYEERVRWLDNFEHVNGRKATICEVEEGWGIGKPAVYMYLKNHGILSKIDSRTATEIEFDRDVAILREELLRIRKERGFVFVHEIVGMCNMNLAKVYKLPEDVLQIATYLIDYKTAHKMNRYFDKMNGFIKEHGRKPTSADLSKMVGGSYRNAYMFVKRHGEPLSGLLDLAERVDK